MDSESAQQSSGEANDQDTGTVRFSEDGLRAGFLACIPVAFGVAGYGVVFGVLAREAGVSVVTTVLMSATVLAGAAQLIAVGMWDWPVPVFAVVGTTFVVNLRYLLMGASLGPWFRQLTTRQAYFSLFFMADENWALTVEDLRTGSGRGAFLLGSGLAIWSFWVVATAMGAMAGGLLSDPAKFGLDFVLIGVFLALVVGFWDGRESIARWTIAAVVAIVVSTIDPGRWHILAGGIAASAVEVIRNVR